MTRSRREPSATLQGTAPHPLDAAPAGVPLPTAPNPERDARGRKRLPERVHLKHNAHVADAFGSAGQKISYPFTAKAGELSLFELVGAAFERGGSARVRLSILDEADRVLWQSERRGGVTWRAFWSFAAGRDGAYRLEMVPIDHPFRYVLVRHSDYRARRDGEVLALGERTLVHSYLASAEDRARFALELAPGEEVGVKVLGTRAEARQEARLALREGREGRETRMGGGQQFPTFELATSRDGRSLVSGKHFALVRAARGGTVEVEVSAHGCPDGGLFDLEIERPFPKERLFGVVVDAEDRPVADVQLRFLREPDHDPVGRCVTAEDGSYELEVPTGNTVIRLERARRDPSVRAGSRAIQTRISGGELNLLYLR